MPKAYKLLRIRNGKLYPLYVNTEEETPIGVWLKAKPGERTKNGKVKSKLGPLAFRPLYEHSYNGRYMNPFFIRTIKKYALFSCHNLKSSYKSIGDARLHMF